MCAPASSVSLVHQPTDLQVGRLHAYAAHLLRPRVVAREELIVEHRRVPVRRAVVVLCGEVGGVRAVGVRRVCRVGL